MQFIAIFRTPNGASGSRSLEHGKQQRSYTEEFKRDAVRMMRSRGTRTVTEVADDLGVPANQLHRWAKVLDADAVAKRNEQGETVEEENRRLRKENERLRMEKAILKNAAADSTTRRNGAVVERRVRWKESGSRGTRGAPER